MEFIEFLSKDALSELNKANEALVKMVSNVDAVGQKMKGISSPSGSDSAIKQLTLEYQKQEKVIQSLQAKLEKASIKQQNNLEKERVAQIKLDQARAKAVDNFTKNETKQQQLLERSNSVYNKVQQKVNSLSKTYNDIAIRRELGLKLSTKEEGQLLSITERLNKYQSALKKVDADIQKNQRNVGNYSGSFNGLSNSINQITRELPAFTFSAQTGFLALSNNIPILTDEIGKLQARNKELIAQGQPIKSVFSQIAASLFSLQTVMGIAILGLTLYGGKIWESISGSKARAQALEKEKKAVEEKSKAEDQARETLARYQSEEISRAKILFENAKNLTLPYAERLKAVNELQKRYPEYLGNLSKEQILAGDTALAEQKLNDALVKRGIALASQDLIQQSINDKLKNQKWLSDKLNEAEQKRLELGAKISKISPFTQDEDQRARYEDLKLQLERINYLEGTLREQYDSKNKAIEDSIKYYIEQYNANAKYIGVVKEETTATKESNKSKEDQATVMKNSENAFNENIKALKKTRDEVDKTSESYKFLTNMIGLLETIQKNIGKAGQDKFPKPENVVDFVVPEISSEQEDQLKWMKDYLAEQEKIEKMRNALDDLFKSISSNALSGLGLGSLNAVFDGTFNKMWDTAQGFNEKFAVGMKYIGDIAKETFEFINQQQQANFDAQYSRLEQEKEVALLFAGESATARQEIERQYEERRRSIQKKQAESQKKLAVFNSIINTAQGVTSALATGNIPLAITIGILGAIQTAFIASQKIPQFWKGTDNAPEGYAYTQEKGREIITDKHGKVKSLGSDSGAQLTYLNKGDKVFKNKDTEAMLFNNELNGILMNNGISTPIVNVNNSGTTDAQINKIVNAINDKEGLELNFDANGFTKSKIRQGQRIQLLNGRLNTKTFTI